MVYNKNNRINRGKIMVKKNDGTAVQQQINRLHECVATVRHIIDLKDNDKSYVVMQKIKEWNTTVRALNKNKDMTSEQKRKFAAVQEMFNVLQPEIKSYEQRVAREKAEKEGLLKTEMKEKEAQKKAQKVKDTIEKVEGLITSLTAVASAYQKTSASASHDTFKARVVAVSAMIGTLPSDIKGEYLNRITDLSRSVDHHYTELLLIEAQKMLDSYNQAKLENKDALSERFISRYNEIKEFTESSSESWRAWVPALDELQKEYDDRTHELKKEEEEILANIQEHAEKVTERVDGASLFSLLSSMAPPAVQSAYQKILKNSNRPSSVLELGDNTSPKDSSALTVTNTKFVKELLTGTLSTTSQNQLSAMRPDEQAQLISTVINEVATHYVAQGVLTQAEKKAITDYSAALVNNVTRIMQGDATHISITQTVQSEDGEERIHVTHIPLHVLMGDPATTASAFVFDCLRLGNAGASFNISFTSAAQRGALLQLEGVNVRDLRLTGKDPLVVVAQLLNAKELGAQLALMTGAKKPLTMNELVRLGTEPGLSVQTGMGSQQHGASDNATFNVSRFVEAMATFGGVVAAVLNPKNIRALGARVGAAHIIPQTQPTNPLVGLLSSVDKRNEQVFVGGGSDTRRIMPSSAVKPAVTGKRTEEASVVVTPDSKRTEKMSRVVTPGGKQTTASRDLNTTEAKHRDAYKREEQEEYDKIINGMTKEELTAHRRERAQYANILVPLVNDLIKNHNRLLHKYKDPKSDEYKVVMASKKLIVQLKAKLDHYVNSGERKSFVQLLDEYKELIINDTKSVFNTHRDNIVKKFFGDILECLRNLFSSNTEKEKHHARATFFGHTGQRETTAAKALYDFSCALDDLSKKEPSKEEGASYGDASDHGDDYGYDTGSPHGYNK